MSLQIAQTCECDVCGVQALEPWVFTGQNVEGLQRPYLSNAQWRYRAPLITLLGALFEKARADRKAEAAR